MIPTNFAALQYTKRESWSFLPRNCGSHFAAESARDDFQPREDLDRVDGLAGHARLDGDEEPRGVRGGIDGDDLKALQQGVFELATKDQIERIGNLGT